MKLERPNSVGKTNYSWKDFDEVGKISIKRITHLHSLVIPGQNHSNPNPSSPTLKPNPKKSPTDQPISLSDSILSSTDNVESQADFVKSLSSD